MGNLLKSKRKSLSDSAQAAAVVVVIVVVTGFVVVVVLGAAFGLCWHIPCES